jgi:hypothetical protein
VLLAALPAAAQAAEVPEISSIQPEECSSACRVLIVGNHFEEVAAVHFSIVAMKLVVTAPTKGQCKVKSTTEIECVAPNAQGNESRPLGVTVTNSAGTSATFSWGRVLPGIYRNEGRLRSLRQPVIGFGQLDLNSPQLGLDVECVSLGFGSAWNEGFSEGRGEVLVWWAAGHAPAAERTELSPACRLRTSPLEERPAAAGSAPRPPVTWISAEPDLRMVQQEAIVCAERSEHFLHECASEAEQVHEAVIRGEITREALTLPWNVAFSERGGQSRAVIGLPFECRGKTGSERTELSNCPEASEREVGPASGCNAQPPPAPAGCLRIGIYGNPPLNLRMHFEGYVEPLNVNGGPTGLSPSTWEFEGHAKGEPALHLRETPTSEGSITGSLKTLGSAGQELMQVK